MGVLASPGRPWHHGARDATQGDHWMSIDELLHLSSLLLQAVVMWWLHIHLREIERDKQRVVRQLNGKGVEEVADHILALFHAPPRWKPEDQQEVYMVSDCGEIRTATFRH